MTADSPSAHLTAQTPLAPSIQAWELYLNDQGRSPNTVKAFLSDVRLLTQYLASRPAPLWCHHHQGPQPLLRVDGKGPPVPCSPKTPGAAHHFHQVLLPLVCTSTACCLVDPRKRCCNAR